MEDSNLFEELRIRDIELRKKWMEGDLTKLTGKPSKDKPHLKFYPEYALQGKLPEDTLYGDLYECNKAHMLGCYCELWKNGELRLEEKEACLKYIDECKNISSQKTLCGRIKLQKLRKRLCQ